MRIAVFDLGTNVFNLLIADISKGACGIVDVIKMGSQIGKGGFKSGYLTQEAIDRSLETFSQMYSKISQYGSDIKIKAFATSAVRDAKNGEDFAFRLRSLFPDVDLEIISGDREAELICKGIRESILLYGSEKVLMLDIGGGSNEFIIADSKEIFWKKSYPLGVIRMREIVEPHDPMTVEDIEKYTSYIDTQLESLYSEVSKHNISLMIGSSGSFDTLKDLIFPNIDNSVSATELPLQLFDKLNVELIKSTRDQRLKMAGMVEMRADYMVLGSIFVSHVIEKLKIKQLYQSSYSLKEGYMSEFAQSLK